MGRRVRTRAGARLEVGSGLSIGGVIFVGNVGDGFAGFTDVPHGIVEVGRGCVKIGGDADAPVLIEQQGRAEVGGVKGNLGGGLAAWGDGAGVAMRVDQMAERAGQAGRRRGRGRSLASRKRSAHEQRSQDQHSPAHNTSHVVRALHFNSAGCRDQGRVVSSWVRWAMLGVWADAARR